MPTVIRLGAAVLLLDAAVVLAFAPEALGDLRRARAALPLIALAIVPCTLVRPQLPYPQGLVLFALLAGFQWGERLERRSVATAIALAAARRLRRGHRRAPPGPRTMRWFDYRAWAGALVHQGGRLRLESDLRPAALAAQGPRGADRPRRQR